MTNKLTITKGYFLEWYFNNGQDTEKVLLRLELANKIINNLFDTDNVNTSIDDIFEFTNKDAIPVSYCEQYLNDNTDKSIYDMFRDNYEITIK